MGNHEDMMLQAQFGNKAGNNAFDNWRWNGGDTTLKNYGNGDAGKLIPHLLWMQRLPTFLDLGDLFLVHAGIHPKVPLEKQIFEEFFWVRDEHLYCLAPYFKDKLIINGHTPTLNLPGVKAGKLAAGPGWLDIDTGVCYSDSGWLTAVDLDSGMVYQVNVNNSRRRTLFLHLPYIFSA